MAPCTEFGLDEPVHYSRDTDFRVPILRRGRREFPRSPFQANFQPADHSTSGFRDAIWTPKNAVDGLWANHSRHRIGGDDDPDVCTLRRPIPLVLRGQKTDVGG